MITILSWNMQFKRDSWRFLRERHGDADIALLQEACIPPEDVADKLDVGPGPWVHKGWNGARAIVRIADNIAIERISVADIIASAPPPSAIGTPASLAVAIAKSPGGEQIGLVSVEMSHKTSPELPEMVREIQRHCGVDLPYIVGGDLTTWWDSKTTVFADMMRMGLPLIGPHSATFYSQPNRQTPYDAQLQLDYVFASRQIAHRITVRALNDPSDWGPSDHCRVLIEVAER